MDLEDFITQLRQMAKGKDKPTVTLFDRHRAVELVNDPDSDTWDFEIMRGDDGPVIEFD
jgi:hypothetical protein